MVRNAGVGPGSLSRRHFFLQSATGLTATWLSMHWPAIASAAAYARTVAQSSAPQKLQFLTPEEAKEIDAIAARVIPADDTPGAREAGVIYFIDRALVTFAVDNQKNYREGLPDFQAHLRAKFPGTTMFSAATVEQQDAVLESLTGKGVAGRGGRAMRSISHAPDFFELVRQHTVIAFFIDPEFGTDPKGIGWQLIGRENEHAFSSPFGFYDKDYPGYQAGTKGDK